MQCRSGFELESLCPFPTTITVTPRAPPSGVWVTASLCKCPGLFSVFWPILTILYFKWSRFVLRFPTSSSSSSGNRKSTGVEKKSYDIRIVNWTLIKLKLKWKEKKKRNFLLLFFFFFFFHVHMGSSMMDVWTLQLNAQDCQFDWGNYCCSFIRVASIDENKNSHRKITMTHTQTTYINRIALRAGKKGARPAEVGALASVFEKSATELKLKQKLLKCKQAIQIATFNVRTLNRIGQLPELIASAVEHKIDIICIQEHRYTHTEDIKYHQTGNGWTLATVSAWKNPVNTTVGGVGMLRGPKAIKTLYSIERIQPRMMTATFNGNPRATIISCYSPTNISEETKLATFYDELSSLVRSIPKHNLLIIGRDMNAQIGKNRHNKYSLHNTSNRNGQHLTDFMIENRLTCLNTNYQKREGKLWTTNTWTTVKRR